MSPQRGVMKSCCACFVLLVNEFAVFVQDSPDLP